MNILKKLIITIILSLIPALYTFYFYSHTDPDSRIIDNIRTSRIIFIMNMLEISYIIFNELPAYL